MMFALKHEAEGTTWMKHSHILTYLGNTTQICDAEVWENYLINEYFALRMMRHGVR